MGSSFTKMLNPMAALDIPGRLAGNNSWLARMTSYDPIMKTSVGKVLAPNMYARGQAYAQRHDDPNAALTAQNRPTPYAGLDPTLRDANAGYVTAANNAVNQQNKTWQQGSASQNPNPYGQ